MILTESDNSTQNAPEWVRLTEAARRLSISHAKLSRWVKSGRITSHKDPRDERVTFVNMVELNKIFSDDE